MLGQTCFHEIIIVCAANEFRKYQKMRKKELFKNSLKNLSQAKILVFGVFFGYMDLFLSVLQFDKNKNCYKTLFFL